MFNQKLINDLREGKIVLENRPKDSAKVRSILSEAFPKQGYTEAYYGYYFVTNNNKDDYECTNAREYAQFRGTLVTIADFLIPEPKFEVGDKVIVCDYPLFKEAVIKEVKQNPDTGNWAYMVSDGMTGSYISEDLLSPVSEQQFEIGQQYEFSVCNDWIKGTLLGIVDNQYKYIALVGTNKVPLAFDLIRPIQPRKITRWINICPDGRVLRKSYETEQEARGKACQGGMHDCRQVRLEGVIS